MLQLSTIRDKIKIGEIFYIKEQRTTLMKTNIIEKSYAEVGRAEGVHSGSVRGSVLRGLENMKEYLKENW